MSLPDTDEWPVDAAPGELLGDPAGDLLRARADATPDRVALVDADAGDRWTYAGFDDRVARRVDALADACGVDPAAEPRIGLLLDTRVAFADAYFVTERLAAAVVLLNVELPPADLATQAARAEIDCLVCEAETEALATEISPADVPVASVDAPASDRVASLATSDSGGPGSHPGRAPPGRPPVEHGLDADRVVAFTSGTTGTPKGVRLTRRNLLASATASAHRLGVAPDDRWLVCLPMYHVGGLSPLVRSTLYGTTTVVQRSFDAGETAAVMAEYGITAVSLVPTMLTRLLDDGWTPPASLRFVLLGGAPARAALVERALDRGVPVYPTYGLTETASQVATATPGEAANDPETVGRPLRGTDVTLLAKDGTAADQGEPGDSGEPGEPGELVVSGPTVTPGYLDADRTDAAFGADGLRTGDLGVWDAAGRLRIVGRVDDRIVTGGENVHPATVATALREHPAVADAAVVGLPDAEWGEQVAALVAVEAEGVSAGDLRTFAREHLADFAVPKRIDVATVLPRTASGTVDRDAVRDRLQDQDGGSPREPDEGSPPREPDRE